MNYTFISYPYKKNKMIVDKHKNIVFANTHDVLQQLRDGHKVTRAPSKSLWAMTLPPKPPKAIFKQMWWDRLRIFKYHKSFLRRIWKPAEELDARFYSSKSDGEFQINALCI